MGAGEGFFLRAVLWSLLELEFWTMPVTAVLGALTKEPFIPFCIISTVAWELSSRFDRSVDSERTRLMPTATSILSSWVLGFAALQGLLVRSSACHRGYFAADSPPLAAKIY